MYLTLSTPNQLRAARALLGWEQKDLANGSGLAIGTIRRMEGSRGAIRGNVASLRKVQRALEDAGVVFIDENGGGPGVRLRDAGGR